MEQTSTISIVAPSTQETNNLTQSQNLKNSKSIQASDDASSGNTADGVQLHPEWKKVLGAEFGKPYMKQLRAFLKTELKKGKTIYPRGPDIFNALNTTPLSRVKVVILGQDPYHGPGQAHGLCFSVQKGVPPPPSLVNIFKELKEDLNIPSSQHGYLQSWAEQGVLLLNTVLTVEKGKPQSHQGQGWEQFTDQVIQAVNAKEEPVVFFLWGSPAQKKKNLITNSQHIVFKAPHPSPLSAYRGFFGSKHFSKANACLEQLGKEPIDWSLPS